MNASSDWAAAGERIKARDAKYAKFWIPAAENDEQAERLLASIAAFNHRPVPPIDERLRRVAYRHNGEYYVAEVGQPVDPYYCENGVVVAILPGDPLLVCSANRGVLRGEPIYVGKDTILLARFFGDPAPT